MATTGFVKGGIWRITEELGRINADLGIRTHLSSTLIDIDTNKRRATYVCANSEGIVDFDCLVMGTDPLTATRLLGNPRQLEKTETQRFRGSSGKLNLMFSKPVQWKHGSDASDSDAAFRFIFLVSSVDDYEQATLEVMDTDVDYVPRLHADLL